MKLKQLDSHYWDSRYKEGNIGWDIGYVSDPLKSYIDQLIGYEKQVLVPGAGNGYEAQYLHQKGFTNTHILDVSKNAIHNFKNRVIDYDVEKIHHEDFFSHNGKYDLIIEQTFFCALEPKLRKDYVAKTHELLNPGGKIVGVLFDDPLNSDRPPFGGNRKEYQLLFGGLYNLEIIEECYNSIAPRAGRELFIKFVKA